MKTTLRKHLGKNSLAITAIFFAALASTSIARGAPAYDTSFGSGLNNPWGVAVNAVTGQVYVTDTGNNRVLSFNTVGGNQQTFGIPGTPGSGNGQFSSPEGVAVDAAGNVYVVNAGPLDDVEMLNTSGNFVNKSANGLLYGPLGVAVGAAGQVYVADFPDWTFDVFATLGANFGSGLSVVSVGGYTTGMAVDPNTGQVYVAVTANGDFGINRFNSSGGSQARFGTPGSGPGQLGFPVGVAVSANSNVYVADPQNKCVDVFNSSGGFLTSFAAGLSPQGVAVSPTGEIYITDWKSNQVVKYFDPNEWVSGTPHFGMEGAAVGYGQVLGPSVTLDTTHGLLVDGAMTIQSGGSLTVNQGGNITAGTLTNSGQFFVTGGSVTVGGGTGTLMNNAAMTLNGSVSGSLTNNYGASLSAAGSMTGNLLNQGTLTQSGVLSVSGSFTNVGTANISAGQQLQPGSNVTNSGTVNLNGGAIVNGGSFTNSGLIVLSGGAITGGGNFTNAVGATIRGDGTITMNVTNSGGLIYATGGNGLTLTNFGGNNISGGRLRVADGDSLTVSCVFPWQNNSTITLEGPNATFNGSEIVNNGTISGQGCITNYILNEGTIMAVGGQLVLAGYAGEVGYGSIESAAGTSILVSQGLANNHGLIALTGGAFDNDGNPMSNFGSILGNGSFSTGGLSNSGTVTFSDGNSSIFGAVTNNSGGTLSTYGTSAAGTIISFYSPVTNSAGGLIQINSSTVRFLGGFTGNAPIIVDPADVYFTGLTMGATGVLQGGVGDSFFVTAPFTNAGQINLGGNSQMVVENGGTLTQTSGVLHLGSSATLTAGMVEINGGMLLADGPLATITASLSYASSSISTYQGVLAGARNTLTLDNPAALLVLSGSSNSYTGGTYVEAGTLEITNKSALPNSTSLTIGAGGTFIFDPPLAVAPAMASDISPVPEPGTLVLLTVAGLGAAVCQSVRSRRQRF